MGADAYYNSKGASPPPYVPVVAGKVVEPFDPSVITDYALGLELMREINKFRSEQGVKPMLSWNRYLATAAYWHSSDMKIRNVWGHTVSNGPYGDGYQARVLKAGWQAASSGEIIMEGATNVVDAVNTWKNSKSGHREAMLNPNFSSMGGAGVGVPGAARYWAVVFDSALESDVSRHLLPVPAPIYTKSHLLNDIKYVDEPGSNPGGDSLPSGDPQSGSLDESYIDPWPVGPPRPKPLVRVCKGRYGETRYHLPIRRS